MADLKISQFADGGLVENTDEIAAVRGGVNTKVTVGSAARYEVGTGSGQIATTDMLSPVALSNDYNDLDNLPTLGDLAAKDQVEASDINAGSSTAGQVPTSDGSGGVTWEDQSGSGTVAATAVSATDPNDSSSTNVQALLSVHHYHIGQIIEIDVRTGSTIPDNSGAHKFIELTAGKAGVGGYNEGLLTGETPAGSGALYTVYANIAVGPMTGLSVWLQNSMGTVSRAGVTTNTFEQDAMQRITGSFSSYLKEPEFTPVAGSFSVTGGARLGNQNFASETGGAIISLDSSLSPNARTGDRTRDKSVTVRKFMYIGKV